MFFKAYLKKFHGRVLEPKSSKFRPEGVDTLDMLYNHAIDINTKDFLIIPHIAFRFYTPERKKKFNIFIIYLQDEVNKLINSTLREREKEIIRLYYGLDNECLTWEDISKR